MTIYGNYAGKVLSKKHSKLVDAIIKYKNNLACGVKQSLLNILIVHTINDSIIMPTALGTSNRLFAQFVDGEISWTQIKPQYFIGSGMNKLLQPPLQILKLKVASINQGIFSGSPTQIYNQDICKFVCGYGGSRYKISTDYCL